MRILAATFGLAGNVLAQGTREDYRSAQALQVVNALVKANKHFDMLFIPGQNHGTGVLNTQHYLQDYLVHNLLGVEPPDWNRLPAFGEPPTATN